MLILLSRYCPMGKYQKWIQSGTIKTEITEALHMSDTEVESALKMADGILITGGIDVNPSRYGKPEYKDICQEPDDKRDTLEIKMALYALKNKIPLFGICRGEQIINIALGGTLIPDIAGHKIKTKKVRIVSETEFQKIVQISEGFVRCYHHQCVDKLGENLIPTAFAVDGHIEAIELPKKIHPFYMGVQWHPERMGKDKPLSCLLRDAFLEKCINGNK